MSKNKRLQKLFFLLSATRSTRVSQARLRHHKKTRQLRIWLRLLVFVLAAVALVGICREFIP